MPVSQISVFTESRPGHLLRVLNAMKDAGISVRGYAVSDTGDYGIARFVVDKPKEAADALKQSGFACNLTEAVCVQLEERPGAFAEVLTFVNDANINISYSYSLVGSKVVMGCIDVNALEEALLLKNAKVVSQNELA